MSADLCDNSVEKSKQVISSKLTWKWKIALEMSMAMRGEGGWKEFKDENGY